jgi:hypothetical protein
LELLEPNTLMEYCRLPSDDTLERDAYATHSPLGFSFCTELFVASPPSAAWLLAERAKARRSLERLSFGGVDIGALRLFD